MISLNKIEKILFLTICHHIRKFFMLKRKEIEVFKCFLFKMKELIFRVSYIKHFCTKSKCRKKDLNDCLLQIIMFSIRKVNMLSAR